MAQVEVRFFEDIGREVQRDLAKACVGIVALTHYGITEPRPGDITLVVPLLDAELSSSDAAYEVEISSSSDDWPRNDAGSLLAEEAARAYLDDRAQHISEALQELHSGYAHNIFEVTGVATGWCQYKPAAVRP